MTEYRAAKEAAAWIDGSRREQLRVTGPDRVSFLQGMVTNDVEKLAVGTSCQVTMLTAKGAMVEIIDLKPVGSNVMVRFRILPGVIEDYTDAFERNHISA